MPLPWYLHDLARWLLERKIPQFSEDPNHDFDLRHVGRDSVYFDLRLAEDSKLGSGITPQMGKAIASRLEVLIQALGLPYPTHIAGVPRGGDPFAEALGSRMMRPVIRLKKPFGGEESVTGFLTPEPEPGTKILLVENVTTSGASTLHTESFLRAKGHEVTCVVSVIDRNSGAKEALAVWGITLVALFPMEDLLEFYINEREAMISPCMRAINHAKSLRTPPSGPFHS